MGLQRVLVSMPLLPEHRERFVRALPGTDIRFARPQELDAQELAALDAMVGNPPEAMLDSLKNLRLLQLFTSGVAPHYLRLPYLLPGAVLCSASGAYGQAISEHLLAMLLMLLKRLHEYRDDQQEALWKDRGGVRSIRGLEALVIGAGSIGTAFASLLKALGARTVGVRRTPGGEDPAFDRLHPLEDLDSLLPTADVISLSLPETPATIGLMDARRFALLKPGSFLLNVGRGSAIDQDALRQALREGRLAGAGLDVTTPEPLPPDHPLWREKNLLITPHISGFWHLRETQDQVVDIACRNLAAWPAGPFLSRVDFRSGYRAKNMD